MRTPLPPGNNFSGSENIFVYSKFIEKLKVAWSPIGISLESTMIMYDKRNKQLFIARTPDLIRETKPCLEQNEGTLGDCHAFHPRKDLSDCDALRLAMTEKDLSPISGTSFPPCGRLS
jgi:hypothetical protein